MSEKAMWAYLQPKLKGLIHTERLTDRLIEGLPDVVWTRPGRTGFLELKYLDRLPKDPRVTPVLTYGPHGLQPAQAFWLNRWARHGGRAHILLRVESSGWYAWRALPHPEWVREIVSVTAFEAAQFWSFETFSPSRLVEYLCT